MDKRRVVKEEGKEDSDKENEASMLGARPWLSSCSGCCGTSVALLYGSFWRCLPRPIFSYR